LKHGEINVYYQDSPIIASALLYSLKQYGRMVYVDPEIQVDLSNWEGLFNHDLRYVLFYMFDQDQLINERMKPHTSIYKTKEWIIFDLKKNRGA